MEPKFLTVRKGSHKYGKRGNWNAVCDVEIKI